MGYDPGITYHGDAFIAGAARSIGQDLQTWLQESRDEQKQKEFNVGLATELVKSGKLPADDLQKFLKMNTNAQGGVLAGIARTENEQQQQDQLNLQRQRITQAGTIAGQRDTAAAAGRATQLAVANIHAAAQEEAARIRALAPGKAGKVKTPADQWKDFNTVTKNSTGAAFPDWLNATNPRNDPATGDILFDFPTKTFPPGADGKPVVIPGTTRRIAPDVYQRMMSQGKALQATTTAAPVQASGGAAGGGALTPDDQAALAWARANPNDPRSAQFLKHLGIQ